jgi:CspA family cold shock protein
LSDDDASMLRFEFATAQIPAQPTPHDLVEISGRIKWFDIAKGYGFIVPDNGMADVLVHAAALRKDGYQTVLEGTRIVCEALRRTKGLQVFKILSMDCSTAAHPAEMQIARAHIKVSPARDFEPTTVKWFNRDRGFGFLTRGDGTEDIFIHMETLRAQGITELKPGEEILVRFGDGPKGLMAVDVRPRDSDTPMSH